MFEVWISLEATTTAPFFAGTVSSSSSEVNVEDVRDVDEIGPEMLLTWGLEDLAGTEEGRVGFVDGRGWFDTLAAAATASPFALGTAPLLRSPILPLVFNFGPVSVLSWS